MSGMNGTTPIVGSTLVWQENAGYTMKANPPMGIYSPVNTSNQIVWTFVPGSVSTGNSTHISGVQRLPNGNSIGTSGEMGHMYEVTSAGQLVWEYVNPVQSVNGVKTAISYLTNPTWQSVNQVFRSYRYDVNHPGIKPYVRQYPDGRILPKTLGQDGVGYTLTGNAACINTPCASSSGTNGSSVNTGGGGGGGGGGY